MKLSQALKRLQMKSPSTIIREKQKIESSPSSPNRVFNYKSEESDGENHNPTSLKTSRVPKGCFAVCVGEEMKRYVVPLKYLKHPIFMTLLRKAEEEFGFNNNGAIRLSCVPVLFEHLLELINKDASSDPKHRNGGTDFILSVEKKNNRVSWLHLE